MVEPGECFTHCFEHGRTDQNQQYPSNAAVYECEGQC